MAFAMPNLNPQTESPKNPEKPKDSSEISSSRSQRMTGIIYKIDKLIWFNCFVMTLPILFFSDSRQHTGK